MIRLSTNQLAIINKNMAIAYSTTILPLFIFTCFATFLQFQTATCSTNETDLLSLVAFKSAIDLDPQGALNSWNQTTHFCRWSGIRCGRRHPDRVFVINLRSQGLVGPLSPHIGNLSFLKAIILQNNTFHGPIPTEISLLRRLVFVEFSNNSFVGPIPKNLSHSSPNFYYLNLIDNNLSGTIPTELGSMSKLTDLGLGGNQLVGPIPPSIGNLTLLTQLSLGDNGLTGEIPESLSQLQRLDFLGLSDNELTGTIPSALFNISSIEWFQVAVNKLNGVIPSTIGLTLPNLKRLYLRENQFSGPIPASISNASLLERIIFSGNQFTGPFPSLGRLTHLQVFLFAINLIADDINFISSLTNSTILEYVELGDNLLTGSLPESIANLSRQLSRLNIQKNRIHGNIPSGIGNLVGLTSLYLSDNHLEGPIPVTIGKLSSLQEIVFLRNRLTNELPSSLGNLTTLSRLYISENRFLGDLPSSIGNCTTLLELDLSRNNFSGLLPPEIMNLSSISILLDLSNNNFTGSIPNEVGSLTNLVALDLSSNKLSGLIPDTLRLCMSLEKLYLDENLLEGEISLGLSTLMGLQELGLSQNNLSGQIPIFLGNLNLKYLNISFNKLEGEVPKIGVFENISAVSLDGNKELCGGIPDLNLSPCSTERSHKKTLSILLKILIPILVVGGICLMLIAFFTYKKRMSQETATPESPLGGVQFMRLSYADLVKATGGFLETNLLGVGRFGCVYKGILDDGKTLIAVKVLNLFVEGASKSFMAECNALRNVRHRNLLKILSACESIDFQGNDFKALVYEFKANGSLEKLLYGNREEEGENDEEANALDMVQRLNISIDIAQAIEYLHSGTDSSVVHGDLKPSNILLDHDMTACVGDFGLAKIVSEISPSHDSSTSIGIRGTIGYVPPEYGTSHPATTQGDVYSFGIVLLEMFTNKRPTDVDSFKDHVNLHNFVGAALPDRVTEIVDPQLRSVFENENGTISDCMISILSIGLSCSKEMPRDRMLMTDVVVQLHKIQKLLCG